MKLYDLCLWTEFCAHKILLKSVTSNPGRAAGIPVIGRVADAQSGACNAAAWCGRDRSNSITPLTATLNSQHSQHTEQVGEQAAWQPYTSCMDTDMLYMAGEDKQ
ncbi:hypothetical protein HaLaN_17692, partial [Haematococcus lacustris]